MTSRRANGEGSIFPYRNGFAAYVWITTPSGKRQRKYVYGRTREIVHSRWIELTRKAARAGTSVNFDCATLLVDLDVHPRVIMRILRHADQAVTMEIYANASSAATREALRRLGDILD